MKTLVTLSLVAVASLVASPARAQIDSLTWESALTSQMESDIRGCATPIMRILTNNPTTFRQTNNPDYKTNDVPYEFTTTARTLEGVLLCPVSGHVPFGSRDVQVMQRNARKFADHNETALLVNGKTVATVKHNGAYVARLPFKIQLQPGKNTIVMRQRNLKTNEVAHVGGFPMGRQFNIHVQGGNQQGQRNSGLGACRIQWGTATLRLGRRGTGRWSGLGGRQRRLVRQRTWRR